MAVINMQQTVEQNEQAAEEIAPTAGQNTASIGRPLDIGSVDPRLEAEVNIIVNNLMPPNVAITADQSVRWHSGVGRLRVASDLYEPTADEIENWLKQYGSGTHAKTDPNLASGYRLAGKIRPSSTRNRGWSKTSVADYDGTAIPSKAITSFASRPFSLVAYRPQLSLGSTREDVRRIIDEKADAIQKLREDYVAIQKRREKVSHGVREVIHPNQSEELLQEALREEHAKEKIAAETSFNQTIREARSLAMEHDAKWLHELDDYLADRAAHPHARRKKLPYAKSVKGAWLAQLLDLKHNFIPVASASSPEPSGLKFSNVRITPIVRAVESNKILTSIKIRVEQGSYTASDFTNDAIVYKIIMGDGTSADMGALVNKGGEAMRQAKKLRLDKAAQVIVDATPAGEEALVVATLNRMFPDSSPTDTYPRSGLYALAKIHAHAPLRLYFLDVPGLTDDRSPTDEEIEKALDAEKKRVAFEIARKKVGDDEDGRQIGVEVYARVNAAFNAARLFHLHFDDTPTPSGIAETVKI